MSKQFGEDRFAFVAALPQSRKCSFHTVKRRIPFLEIPRLGATTMFSGVSNVLLYVVLHEVSPRSD
jgi:hypothetical protein